TSILVIVVIPAAGAAPILVAIAMCRCLPFPCGVCYLPLIRLGVKSYLPFAMGVRCTPPSPTISPVISPPEPAILRNSNLAPRHSMLILWI
ncbi:hypothetical protein EI94DRAFT_1737533, partial [Lactarius quietus]